MLTAVESVRRRPTTRAVFAQAKVVHLVEGAAYVETASGTTWLQPGMSFAIGPDRWCRIFPQPSARLWTVYADEIFLRAQLSWMLADPSRVHEGVHPDDWDGRAAVYNAGKTVFDKVEPIWRQLSVLYDGSLHQEAIAVRSVELFARWVGIVLPVLLTDSQAKGQVPRSRSPISGRLAGSIEAGHVERAARIVRERMEEPWTVDSMARAVSMSRSHLTRLFVAHKGLPPMQLLIEMRLAEFTRLIEETDMTVAGAAHAVGWNDPRIASSWFLRRYGITPSLFRRTPHAHHITDEVSSFHQG